MSSAINSLCFEERRFDKNVNWQTITRVSVKRLIDGWVARDGYCRDEDSILVVWHAGGELPQFRHAVPLRWTFLNDTRLSCRGRVSHVSVGVV